MAPGRRRPRRAKQPLRCAALADQQRKTRAKLVGQRTTEAKALAGLQVQKASIDGERRIVEPDLGPARYLATLNGVDSETALR